MAEARLHFLLDTLSNADIQYNEQKFYCMASVDALAKLLPFAKKCAATGLKLRTPGKIRKRSPSLSNRKRVDKSRIKPVVKDHIPEVVQVEETVADTDSQDIPAVRRGKPVHVPDVVQVEQTVADTDSQDIPAGLQSQLASPSLSSRSKSRVKPVVKDNVQEVVQVEETVAGTDSRDVPAGQPQAEEIDEVVPARDVPEFSQAIFQKHAATFTPAGLKCQPEAEATEEVVAGAGDILEFSRAIFLEGERVETFAAGEKTGYTNIDEVEAEVVQDVPEFSRAISLEGNHVETAGLNTKIDEVEAESEADEDVPDFSAKDVQTFTPVTQAEPGYNQVQADANPQDIRPANREGKHANSAGPSLTGSKCREGAEPSDVHETDTGRQDFPELSTKHVQPFTPLARAEEGYNQVEDLQDVTENIGTTSRKEMHANSARTGLKSREGAEPSDINVPEADTGRQDVPEVSHREEKHVTFAGEDATIHVDDAEQVQDVPDSSRQRKRAELFARFTDRFTAGINLLGGHRSLPQPERQVVTIDPRRSYSRVAIGSGRHISFANSRGSITQTRYDDMETEGQLHDPQFPSLVEETAEKTSEEENVDAETDAETGTGLGDRRGSITQARHDEMETEDQLQDVPEFPSLVEETLAKNSEGKDDENVDDESDAETGLEGRHQDFAADHETMVPRTFGARSGTSNLVATMTSFLPLVMQQQPVAQFANGKKDVKVKALEAAEAARKQEEKRMEERKRKMEMLKREKVQNRLEQEKTKKLEEEQKKKDEERKKKEMMDQNVKKRKKDEMDRKEKRRKLDDVIRSRKEQEEKMRADLEEKENRRKAMEEAEREKKAMEEELKKQRRLEKEKDAERRRKAEEDAKAAWLLNKEADRKRREETFQRMKMLEKEQRNHTEKEPEIPTTAALRLPNKTVRSMGGNEKFPGTPAVRSCGGFTVKSCGTLRKPFLPSFSLDEDDDDGPLSYEMSPYKSSESEDETEDDDKAKKATVKKHIPRWASKENVMAQLKHQAHTDPDDIFSGFRSCSLKEVFGTSGSKKRKDFSLRGNSGDWLCDMVTWKEELQYKKSMGYLPADLTYDHRQA